MEHKKEKGEKKNVPIVATMPQAPLCYGKAEQIYKAKNQDQYKEE